MLWEGVSHCSSLPSGLEQHHSHPKPASALHGHGKHKPPVRGLRHRAVLRMGWRCIREAEGAPQNNNKNIKMQSILRFYRKQTGNS